MNETEAAVPAEPCHRALFSDKCLHLNLEMKAAFAERTPVTGGFSKKICAGSIWG